MLADRIEGKWIDCFARVFELCGIGRSDEVAILSETQSRQINVQLSELALHRLGARPFHVIVPTPPLESTMPIRSTGASNAVQQLRPVIGALSSSVAVIDNTVEGMLHSIELAEILSGGTRLFMISNEHPEILERLMPIPELKAKVEAGAAMMRNAKEMRPLRCRHRPGHRHARRCADRRQLGLQRGQELGLALAGRPVRLLSARRHGERHRRNGQGDVNLTFKRYLEQPITLHLENDFITEIEGDSLDGELMRSYFAGWQDRNAYASAISWGMNPTARWDALTMYDKGDTNGTELRVFAGNFLFSTGANKFANRYTLGHFDLPMRNCTVLLDGKTVVEKAASFRN